MLEENLLAGFNCKTVYALEKQWLYLSFANTEYATQINVLAFTLLTQRRELPEDIWFHSICARK